MNVDTYCLLFNYVENNVMPLSINIILLIGKNRLVYYNIQYWNIDHSCVGEK